MHIAISQPPYLLQIETHGCQSKHITSNVNQINAFFNRNNLINMKLLLMCFYIFFDLINTNFPFRCMDGSQIVTDQFVCDGFGRCGDCSDQRNCSGRADMIPCNNGPNALVKCFLPEQPCDGIPDCVNCFDERNCPHSERLFCEN